MRVLYDPAPRQTDDIFSPANRATFFADHEVTRVDPTDRDRAYATHLPETEVPVGQQPMGRDRLDKAPNLRAIFNVETNFLPNIDYMACFQRGIHVLAPASVFAVPVAEVGLGMALSPARNIHRAHGDFVAGREQYGLDGNAEVALETRDRALAMPDQIFRDTDALLVPSAPGPAPVGLGATGDSLSRTPVCST